MADTCPQCGAEQATAIVSSSGTHHKCGSISHISGAFLPSRQCLANQLAAKDAELAPLRRLKAAVEELDAEPLTCEGGETRIKRHLLRAMEEQK